MILERRRADRGRGRLPDRRRRARSPRDPVALAEHLLEQIRKGHVPTWPSTESWARDMATGLAALASTRGKEVVRAVLLAPDDGPIHWRTVLVDVFAGAE